MVSRVPSVKYRGFFINDEWPAFGNWAKTHFGSMNAACYAPVFELLLRMKGNYLGLPCGIPISAWTALGWKAPYWRTNWVW